MYWTIFAEEKFIDMMVDASVNGLFKFGQSNKALLSDIVSNLRRLTGQDFTLSGILLKLNELHEMYAMWQWVNSQTGVSWDPEAKALVAKEEVWNAILQEKSMAAVYRFRTESNWTALTLIFFSELVHEGVGVNGGNDDDMEDLVAEYKEPGDNMVIVISDDEEENLLVGAGARDANHEILHPVQGGVFGSLVSTKVVASQQENSEYSSASSPSPMKTMFKFK